MNDIIPPQKNSKFEPNKKWLIILSIILIVIIIAVVVVLVINKKSVPENDITDKKEEQLIRHGRLTLSLVEENIEVNDEFEVDIRMDTQDSNIVIASAYVIYDTEFVELIEVDTKDSDLSMSIPDENKDGMINIARGAPGDGDYDDKDDGYNGSNGLVATLQFKALKVGSSDISFNQSSSSMILDDSMGTEMVMDYEDLTLNIQ